MVHRGTRSDSTAAAATKRLEKSLALDVDVSAMTSEARRLLDDDEYERLVTLPWSAKVLTLARMDQVLAWIGAKDGRGDATDYAAAAAADVSRFYRMVNTWDDTRSISAFGAADRVLAPRAPKVPVEVRAAVEARMKRLLADRPEAQLDELIADGARIGMQGVPGRTTLYKWAKGLKAAAVRGPFGTPVLAIASLEARLDDGTQHEVALVVDRGTGLPLGAAVATNSSAFEAYERAAEDARRRLSETRLKGVKPTRGRIDLQLVDLTEADYAQQILTVYARKEPTYTRIVDAEAKRIIRASIGDRLGYLRIAGGIPGWRHGVDAAGPATQGRGRPGIEAADDWPRMSVADLDWVLMRAVDGRLRHDLDQADGGEGSAAHGVRMRVVKVLADMRSEEKA